MMSFGRFFTKRQPTLQDPDYREQEDDGQMMFSRLVDQYGQGDDEGLDTPIFDQYMQTVQNRPQREDYQPSIGRKILGGLAGAMTGFTSGAKAGQNMVQDITEGPYRQAQADYQAELEPLEKGVGFERAFGETLRKRLNDRQNYGVKVAKLESDYQAAQDKLDIALKRAGNDAERNRILAAKQSVDAEYQRERAKTERLNAGANQTRANASMVSAKAKERNAQTYGAGGSGRAPRHVPINEQLRAEAVGAKEALDITLNNFPYVKEQGVTLDNTGKLVFPKDMDPRIIDIFTKAFEQDRARISKARLDQTY